MKQHFGKICGEAHYETTDLFTLNQQLMVKTGHFIQQSKLSYPQVELGASARAEFLVERLNYVAIIWL